MDGFGQRRRGRRREKSPFIAVSCMFLIFVVSATAVSSHANMRDAPTSGPVFMGTTVRGPLVDAKCNAEDVELANDEQLGSILEELVIRRSFVS